MSKQLDDITARVEAATPGPWRCVYDEYQGHAVIEDDAGQVVAGYGGSLGDSLFIANAPTDLRHLLAIARAAERLANAWREFDSGGPMGTSNYVRAAESALRAALESKEDVR